MLSQQAMGKQTLSKQYMFFPGIDFFVDLSSDTDICRIFLSILYNWCLVGLASSSWVKTLMC